MRAIKLHGYIDSQHHLHLDLPDDLTEGPAEVIVLVPDQPSRVSGDDLETFLQELEANPRQTRSKEEIDRYLAEERASWERS